MKLNRCAFPFLLAIAAGMTPPVHADGCNGVAIASKSVADAQRQLQRVSQLNAKNDNEETKVEPAVAEGILKLKQTLADTVDALMACAPETVDTAALSQTLGATLSVRAANHQPEAGDPVYGDILGVEVRREPATSLSRPATGSLVPSMILAHVGFGIACGDDHILLGYVRKGGRWVRTMRWQSDRYSSIDGAFAGDFQYLRLPNGQLVVTHGTAWCSSRFSGFGLDVVTPSPQAQTANDMTRASSFHFHHGYLLGDDETSLKLTANGFEFRAQVTSLDTDLMQKLGIFRFRVDGDTVKRIQPVANNGRDFVDEWLQVDEERARSLTAPVSVDAAISERGRFLATAKKQGLGISYGAVRACTSPGLFQNEMQLNTDEPAKASPHYARIRQEPNGFRLVSFSTSADSQCHGADLMARKRQ